MVNNTKIDFKGIKGIKYENFYLALKASLTLTLTQFYTPNTEFFSLNQININIHTVYTKKGQCGLKLAMAGTRAELAELAEVTGQVTAFRVKVVVVDTVQGLTEVFLSYCLNV